MLKLPIIKGYSLWTIIGDAERRPAAVRYIVEGLAGGALKPVVDRTFRFEEMADAHRYLVPNMPGAWSHGSSTGCATERARRPASARDAQVVWE